MKDLFYWSDIATFLISLIKEFHIRVSFLKFLDIDEKYLQNICNLSLSLVLSPISSKWLMLERQWKHFILNVWKTVLCEVRTRNIGIMRWRYTIQYVNQVLNIDKKNWIPLPAKLVDRFYPLIFLSCIKRQCLSHNWVMLIFVDGYGIWAERV